MTFPGVIDKIAYKTAVKFLLPRHYSGVIPSISYAFGWIIENKIVAVCTFGKPISNHLCNNICGTKFSKRVYELNRLCRIKDLKFPLSQFLAKCLKELAKENLIIVSFSDTKMNHNGYIYQASNFLYTGKTKERKQKVYKGKHSRHNKYDPKKEKKDNRIEVIESTKHRYVYFAIKNKKMRKEVMNSFLHKIYPYPKGENKNYEYGTFLIDGKLQKKEVKKMAGLDKFIKGRENKKVEKFKTLSKGKSKKQLRKLEQKLLKPEPIPKYFGRKAGIGPVEKRSILFIFPSRKDLNRLGKFVKINTAKGNNTQDIDFLMSILELLESGKLAYDNERKTINITKTKKRRRRRKK